MAPKEAGARRLAAVVARYGKIISTCETRRMGWK
jgi:hypothetical protein